MTKPLIPHSRPTVGKEEIDAVSKVIASGQIAQGKEVEAFEHEFSQKMGVKYAAVVSSGTAALHLSLMAMGVSPGDEVIIPDGETIIQVGDRVIVFARPESIPKMEKAMKVNLEYF